MKEIKFRAWNKELKLFMDCENVFINQDGGIYREDTGEWYEDEYDIQMFTGLKDKNDKKMYGGDVVKYYNKEESGIGVIKDMGAINLYIVWLKQHTEYPTLQSDISIFQFPGEVEVIGNIYENPELLEG